MSERKVLTKYFPPDFDPAKLTRQRKPKGEGPKVETVRLMAPFSMTCVPCSEFIYKGRKFNARKEKTDEKYYNISIIRFYIRCTRCSSEITFKTDPKNHDYTCERGAKRNFEPWREAKLAEETEEERLDRLQEEEENRDAMADLEAKTLDAKTEMQIADALDEIRSRNDMRENIGKEGIVTVERDVKDDARERQDREDAEAARRAFQTGSGERVRRLVDDSGDPSVDVTESSRTEILSPGAMAPPPVPVFKRTVKKKRDYGAALGLKKKALV